MPAPHDRCAGHHTINRDDATARTHGHGCHVFAVTRCLQESSRGRGPFKTSQDGDADRCARWHATAETHRVEGQAPRTRRLPQTHDQPARLRILCFHAHDLNLVPSAADYRRHDHGPKRTPRFNKTGNTRLEVAYATHFVWPGKFAIPCGDIAGYPVISSAFRVAG